MRVRGRLLLHSPKLKVFSQNSGSFQKSEVVHYPLNSMSVRWVLQVILTCLSTELNKLAPIFLLCRPSAVCTEFSNLAKGKTFMLALLRHKAGLIHTLDGQQHTRDDPSRPVRFRTCSRRFCLTCMRYKKVRSYGVRYLPHGCTVSSKQLSR